MKTARHLFFFDVETTGLPSGRNIPYRQYNSWPRIVSICWLITDQEGKILKDYYELIRPAGFTIPWEAEKIHGISTAKAESEGISLDTMLVDLSKALNSFNLSHLIAHNIDFDRNVLFSELVRIKSPLLGRLSSIPTACTMKSSTNFCKLPHRNSRYGGYKWPKLNELHRKLFKTGILLEHDAREDITATKNCFFRLQDLGIMNIQLGETRKTSENEAKRKGEPTDLKKFEALANANKLRINENAKSNNFSQFEDSSYVEKMEDVTDDYSVNRGRSGKALLIAIIFWIFALNSESGFLYFVAVIASVCWYSSDE